MEPVWPQDEESDHSEDSSQEGSGDEAGLEDALAEAIDGDGDFANDGDEDDVDEDEVGADGDPPSEADPAAARQTAFVATNTRGILKKKTNTKIWESRGILAEKRKK